MVHKFIEKRDVSVCINHEHGMYSFYKPFNIHQWKNVTKYFISFYYFIHSRSDLAGSLPYIQYIAYSIWGTMMYDLLFLVCELYA